MNIFNANLEVTKATVQGGEIKELEINRQNVPLASSIAIETSKAVTIDASTYSSPVEVTPTAGKDGMKKVTVSLSNIPSGGGATAYAWVNDKYVCWFNFNTSPADKTAFENSKSLGYTLDISVTEIYTGSNVGFFEEPYTLTKVSDTEFVVNVDGQDKTFTRNSVKDFTLW